MTKKLSLLFLICILSALNINAEVYEGSCGANVRYSLDTSTRVLKISGTGAMTNYLSDSDSPWKSNSYYISTVEISNGVTSIGDNAFYGCYFLTSVSIGNSVTSIGSSAFNECSGITSITIPNSVTSIKDRAFCNCSLYSIIMGNSIKSIGDYAFYHNKITSLTFPNSLLSLGKGVCAYCSDLASVTLGNSVEILGERVFGDCNLKELYCNTKKVPTAADNAFSFTPYESGTLYVPRESIDSYKTTTPWSKFGIVEDIGDIYSGSCGYGLNYYFNYNTGVLKITGTGTMKDYTIASDAPWFSFRSYITMVEILDGVKSIGNYAFNDCSNLTSVAIPGSVTSIGSNAFADCSGLTSVTIPNSVTSIRERAFSGCSSLKFIEIPNSVTSIGKDAFSGCTGLKKVIVQDIAAWCGISFGSENANPLYYAHHLYSDENAEITNLVIPNSVTSIGNGAFNGCSGLTSVTIGNSVTSIGEMAFYNCSKLTSVTIGSGVTSIGSPVFSSKPTKVIWLTNTPPQNYTNAQGTVNYVANNNYTSLSNKTVYPFLSSMFVVDGIRYVPVSPSERTCDAIDCVYDDSAEKINIGEKVTNKGISLTVKQVCPHTCYGNTFIKDVKLSFTGDLGNDAFYGCTSLNTATISNQGNIGESAFDGCTNLNTVTINNKGDIGKNTFRECSSITKIDLGNGVTSIGSSAFYRCSKLSSITIPDAVTSIGIYAFNDCTALNSIKIGSGVKSIGYYAFWNCAALEKIQIPQSVTSIDNYVFKGCTRLKTVIMDNGDSDLSLSSNGSNPMFADCPLDSVYIGRNITYNTSSSYGYSPFYRNTSLRTVVITDRETEISDNEFYGCTNLQSFKVGDGVTKFGKYAFSGCSSLKSLSFGAKLQSIEQEAFSDCNAVTTIVSKATTPPVCGSQALDDISKWDCVLYVPEGTISTYQAANQWKEFFFIEEGDPFAILRGDANGDGEVGMPDVMFIVNYILGTPDASFNTEAADANRDGEVGMPDVMFIVNYILNGKFPDEK